MSMLKPLLSIGIIFKNEIRCLERCLKSLQPLREDIPCELVMADTGSDDGSREVAERYADILIDFPWVNDFAAARNAVLERCSGKWHFLIDSDEWLDEDFSELTAFLRRGSKKNPAKGAMVIQRNYMFFGNRENYHDFFALRLCRITPGLRFHGSIHERFPESRTTPFDTLSRVVLHHDGYGLETAEKKQEKARRNMRLLRQELDKDPKSLMRLLQCIESGEDEEDYVDLIRRAVDAVEERGLGWDRIGPPVLRYAIELAQRDGLPELETWSTWAEEWFPDSLYTKIDVQYVLFMQAWKDEDYEQCVRRGESYLKALEDDRANPSDKWSRIISTLKMEMPSYERRLRIFLAGAHLRTGGEMRSVELLEQTDCTMMDTEQTMWFNLVLQELHIRTNIDTVPLISSFWDQITQPKPDEMRAEMREKVVYNATLAKFLPESREKEAQQEYFHRHAYTLYLPLREKCELGRAAAILETDDAAEITELLSKVERWDRLHVEALARAMEFNVAFPLPDNPLNMEEMDGLAGRLAENKERFFPLMHRVLAEDFASNTQKLLWARGLSMAAVREFGWKEEDADTDTGLSVARDFARTESAFLPFCYTPQAMTEENLSVLPPMHRFGWYSIQAFDALDNGDAVGYVRLLRSGLNACQSLKDMVEFLLDRTPELQPKTAPSEELRALADQIRAVLSKFPPDDPAVTALKQSEAYRKVAEFIEGTEVPVMGRLPQ